MPARESLATGTDFLTELVATAQPASSAGALAGSSLPLLWKPHISHSHSAALLRNVQRGHSHSSLGAEEGCEVVLGFVSGFRDMLVDEATARAASLQQPTEMHLVSAERLAGAIARVPGMRIVSARTAIHARYPVMGTPTDEERMHENTQVVAVKKA